MIPDKINTKAEFIQFVGHAATQPNSWNQEALPKVTAFLKANRFSPIFFQDRTFYHALLQASRLTYRFGTTDNRFDLAQDLKELAQQFFQIDPQFNFTAMPSEIKQEIFKQVLQNSAKDFTSICTLSKEMPALALTAKEYWRETFTGSLKQCGCQTAQEAVAFAIKMRLKHLNLSEFPDLTEQDLHQLFRAVDKLDSLSIKSKNINYLPDKDIQLQTLICANCNLWRLPDSYVHVRKLNCQDNHALKSLPESYTNLRALHCGNCALTSLPSSYTLLQELHCDENSDLTSLPESYTELRTLDCSDCDLGSLPSSYTQLQALNCSGNSKLTSLPESYTALKVLDCNSCKRLENLPNSYLLLADLNCSGCKRLRSIPGEYSQLMKLLVRDSFSLTKLSANYVKLAELDIRNSLYYIHLPATYTQLAQIQCSLEHFEHLPENYQQVAQISLSGLG